MFAERLAFELQTYFRSSLLSLRKFRRERSDHPKYVCSPQATERLNRIEYNSYVICKKLGVIRWLDCPCEIIWKLHFSSLSKQFLYAFFSLCLLPSSFFFSPIYPFFLFSRPLARLVISGGQNVSPLVSLQNLQANVLTLEAPLVDFFFVFLCKEFLAIYHIFE